MLGAIERINVAGVDPLDTAAHRQLSPSSPSVSLRGARAPGATTTQSLAQSVNGAPSAALLGISVPELVTQQTLSGIAPKLQEFATGSNMSAIAALIVRLNSELRKSAREDMWAAVGADIAAQDAAAKSIRSTGLYQLFGSIIASSGGIAGAGMNLKGARQSQLQFESNAPKASGLDGRTPDGMDHFDVTRMAHAQTAAAQETMKWGGMAAMTTETSKIAGAGMNMASTQCQEEKAKHDADSTKAKAHAEDERQFIDYYQTQIQDMLSKLAEMRSADSETRSKLVNMA
ncbi:hypothetical protein [Bradyrhizobium diazoefficiens]|uniref:hypothetical protein n=1 Tax=Bradyrhizobium diazoefficiens TaxID=1355477 RepID=UPI001B8C910F|nr:hypothetical protein [Bradyrhizobium diazoefficiens]MBR0867895.1 hypothetical protein [Bradyrhizobium diazoefficiens]MBR0892404.1 hypothetical protein [Bradyrhizobium diazoefficiens]MBR0924392.1 hypothetical protein [Bradyrhizobium diazoefficiens]